MWLIHAAGIVSIANKVSAQVRAANVARGKRLVYVSSVHAIAEPDSQEVIVEVENPEDLDPAQVVGEYAKTKAEATAAVLAADDLWPVVAHPSSITGPGDYADTHLTALAQGLATGRLKALVKGGYDFADVRDVAAGAISAARRGQPGRCYIFSGEYVSVKELAQEVTRVGRKKIPPILPMWVAKAIVPFAAAHYRPWRLIPQFTEYSLYTLLAASNFSHARATKEVGYSPRPMAQTLRDTVEWVPHGRDDSSGIKNRKWQKGNPYTPTRLLI